MYNTHRLWEYGNNLGWETRRWKNEIVNFLNQVWSKDCGLDPEISGVLFDVELAFGDVVLWWGSQIFVPYLQETEFSVIEMPPRFTANEILITDDSVSSIEFGLIRFVKNRKVRALIIRFPNSEVWIWKKSGIRSELGVWARGLPRGRPDVVNDQAKNWLHNALLEVVRRKAERFVIEDSHESEGSVLLIEEFSNSTTLPIPANIKAGVIERLLVMAKVTLDYQYAPAAGMIEFNIKGVGKLHLDVIASRIGRGYKIEVTVNYVD